MSRTYFMYLVLKALTQLISSLPEYHSNSPFVKELKAGYESLEDKERG